MKNQATDSSHIGYYRQNQAYAKRLSRNLQEKYAKYYSWLAGQSPCGKKILDVGCGSGQAVHALARRGGDAYGIEVAKASLALAERNGPGQFQEFDGQAIPFPGRTFDAVGSFTVLEHLENPDLAIREMVRVLKPGGTIVLACPNFLRVVGISAHHPRTRGVINKLRNFMLLTGKFIQLAVRPRHLRFAHMPPVAHDGPFQPDDDAVTITNAIDILGVWRRTGIRKIYHSSLLYPANPILEAFSRLPVVRTLTGGVFLVGKKT